MFEIKKRLTKEFGGYLKITLGLLLCAFALNYFLIPNKIAAGGISGISVILFHLFKLPVGTTMFLMNIVLFGVAFKIVGKNFGARSIFATILLSILVDVMHYVFPVKPLTNDLLIAVIFGDLLSGIGMAIIFNNSASTGGTDIIAKIINKYTSIEIGKSLLMIDFLVGVSAGIFLKSMNVGMYSLLAILINTFTIDAFLVSINIKKKALIISEVPEKIADRIMKEMNRGVTYLDGHGGYTGRQQKVIICVVGTRQINQLINIVREEDQRAFVAVSNVNEVRGEGFKDLKSSD
jgi:uncharacterized membrane-anchored protein YitT (DUF2179 family)